MKTNLLFCLALVALLAACVQETYTKTVVYTLHLTRAEATPTVGIRGNNKPLTWQSDTKMSLNSPDSTYRATVTYRTGYKFTEVKFVVNGTFELAERPNRRVVFSDADTTYYEGTFNDPSTLLGDGKPQ
jgi:hypothetical protein